MPYAVRQDALPGTSVHDSRPQTDCRRVPVDGRLRRRGCRCPVRPRHPQPVEHHSGSLVRHLGLHDVRPQRRPPGSDGSGQLDHVERARDHRRQLQRRGGHERDTHTPATRQRSRRRHLHDPRECTGLERTEQPDLDLDHRHPARAHARRHLHGAEQGLRPHDGRDDQLEQPGDRRRRHSHRRRRVVHADSAVRQCQRRQRKDGLRVVRVGIVRCTGRQLHAQRDPRADVDCEHHRETPDHHAADVLQDLRRQHHGDRIGDPFALRRGDG